MNNPVEMRTVDIDGVTTVYDAYILILKELIDIVNLEGVVLSSSDGLPIASILKPEAEEDYIAAVSPSALTFIEKIAEEINNGGVFEQMIIKISNSLVIISGIGNEAILTVLANGRTNLGALTAEMKKTHERLAELLLGEVVPLLAEIEVRENGVRA